MAPEAPFIEERVIRKVGDEVIDCNRSGKKEKKNGSPGIRTRDQPVMHPTATFAAPFGSVGWTIPSPREPGRLPSSLYTFPGSGLGSGLPGLTPEASPNLTGDHLEITPQAALVFRAGRSNR